MSKLFSNNSRYTPEAMALTRRMDEILIPLFKECIEKGYSPREISHVLILSIIDAENEIILGL